MNRFFSYKESNCVSEASSSDADADYSLNRDSLKGFLDGKDIEPEIHYNENGGVVRLEVFYSAEAAVAYAQLFDFSNYAYEPATEIVELRGPRAEKLISKL